MRFAKKNDGPAIIGGRAVACQCRTIRGYRVIAPMQDRQPVHDPEQNTNGLPPKLFINERSFMDQLIQYTHDPVAIFF